MKSRTKGFDQYLSHEPCDEDADVTQEALGHSLALIGWVVMHFNRLEKMLDSAICEALNDRTDSVGLLVINGMAYASKVDLYKRLCDDMHRLFGQGPAAYEGLIDDLKEAAHLRNLVVHADWMNTDAEGYTYWRLKVNRGEMHQEYVQLKPDSMELVLAKIDAATDKFDKYLIERGEHISEQYRAKNR